MLLDTSDRRIITCSKEKGVAGALHQLEFQVIWGSICFAGASRPSERTHVLSKLTYDFECNKFVQFVN